MAKRSTRKTAAAEPPKDEESAELLEELELASEDTDDEELVREVEEVLPPTMDSVDWHEYVMKQFSETEVDEKGNPNVGGLRRVVRVVLGEVVDSHGTLLQCPTGDPNVPTVAQHTIKVIPNKTDMEAKLLCVTEVSDVTMQNTDFQFYVHASATASTKAEARALRKILGLQRVIAAEEAGGLVFDEPSPDGKITPSLAQIMTRYCFMNGIDIDKVLQHGKQKFKSIEEVPQSVGEKIFEYLQELVRNSKVPAELKL